MNQYFDRFENVPTLDSLRISLNVQSLEFTFSKRVEELYVSWYDRHGCPELAKELLEML